MRLTRFGHVRSAEGRTVELTTIAELIAEVRVCEKKDEAPLFSPTEFAGDKRSNVNATFVHFGVVEYDHLTGQQMLAVCDHIASLGVEHVVYTTHSHDPEHSDYRFRVCVPFRQPVPAAQWTREYWPRLAAYLNPQGISANADPQCKDPARIYYFPSVPPARRQHAIQFHRSGALLDMDSLAPVVPEATSNPTSARPSSAPAPRQVVTVDDLRDYLRKLRKRNGSCALSASECLRLVLRGQEWGDKDTRNERLSNLCYELVKDFPQLDYAQVAQLFSTSCTLMQQQDAESRKYTVKYVEEKLREKVRYVEERQKQYAAENTAAFLKLLQTHGFESAYTSHDIAQLTELEVHPRGWIIQQESGAWVFTPKHGYVYFRSQSAAKNAAAQNLLPARPYGVRTDRYDKNGELRTMPLDDLIAQFGSTPDAVEGSFVAQQSRYRTSTRTLTIAECPLRPLEPKYDRRIDDWFRLLGGKDGYDRLCDWVAWVTYLDRPSVMLVLSGSPESGKTLLANGLARLWSDQGATPLVQALDAFNAQLCRCPLLLADEKIPVDHRGRHRFEEMRELVSKTSFTINDKNIAKRVVTGCVRIIVGVNHLSQLVGETPESEEMLQATLERILHLRCSPAVKGYLAGLTAAGEQWEPDAIAQHALYLRDSRPLPQQAHRFLIAPNAQLALETAFVSSSGMFGAICQWLVAFLRNPGELYRNTTHASDPAYRVKVTPSGLFATPHALQTHWTKYADKRPWQSSIQSAWVGIRERRTTIETAMGTQHTDAINLDRLISYAEEHTISDRDEITTLLADYINEGIYDTAVSALKRQREFANGVRDMRPIQGGR